MPKVYRLAGVVLVKVFLHTRPVVSCGHLERSVIPENGLFVSLLVSFRLEAVRHGHWVDEDIPNCPWIQ